MKIKLLPILAACFVFTQFSAQHHEFYATTDKKSAVELQKKFPEGVKIIETRDNHAAVYLTEKAGEFLHHNVVTHGPGYVYKSTEQEAIAAINTVNRANRILSFTIDQNALVNTAISKVSAENIKSHIQLLENYGTRYHTTSQAQTSVADLKTKWENLIAAAGRDDISVRTVNHSGTMMPSLILTITGKDQPDDYVIVGAHMDSTAPNHNQAPGADDDASGIATITEMIRVLLNIDFQPAKTVEFMAFAAEEIGLVGSSEIAADYAAANKNVISFVQFDMTNYKGSPNDIYLTRDNYNSNDLNLFLIELMSHYNASGTHAFTYGNTNCNYGCSDHFSWAQNGYDAAFPFEASFSNYNPKIHTSQDTLSNMGNSASHAAKFAKLGLEFIIETAKSSVLATGNPVKSGLKIAVENKILKYSGDTIQHLQILDTSGRKLLDQTKKSSNGNVNLESFPKGFYLAVFKTGNGQMVTKKFILN